VAETETCERCGTAIDDHTVAELRRCMSDLHSHHLPFEEADLGDQDLQVLNAGAIAVKAGVTSSPLGTHPVLVFEFTGPDGVIPPIALVLDDTHMRSVRHLLGSAVDAAIRAAWSHRRPHG
jgi:hypothetical protein